MLRTVLSVVLAALIIAPVADAQSGTSGSFNWKPPCSNPVKQTSKSGMTSFTCNGENGSYMLVVDLLPKGAVPDVFIDNVIDRLGKTTKGTLRTSVPITENGLTGREVIYDLTSGWVVRGRWLIAKGMVISLNYYGPPGSENSKPVMDFFNSFHMNS